MKKVNFPDLLEMADGMNSTIDQTKSNRYWDGTSNPRIFYLTHPRDRARYGFSFNH
jgi:hypothetical protein